jgi:hypothetical protein
MPVNARLSAICCAVFTLSSACAGHAPPANSADSVRVDKGPPGPGAQPIRALRAVDGHGCGLFGTLGTYEGASANLRDQARAIGADYVQVTEVKEPHASRECVEKEYTLLGIAYRTTAPAFVAPAPLASASAPAPATSAGCRGGRALEFSARADHSAAFGVWIDETPSSAPSGLQLRYEPSAQRIELVRYPEATAVAVSDARVDLGTEWHAWRLERSADRVSVWLDGALILLHAAPPPVENASFGVDAQGLELRGMRPGCASEPR